MRYIVDIKGEIEGDYEILGKYEERPKGEWISDWRDDLDAMSRRGWKCSCCSWRTSYGTPRFCMNCGAEMKDGK